MSLRLKLAPKKFIVTTEVAPLKGTDITEIVELAGLLKGRVDAVNVTDQQSAVMRLGSLATCHILKEQGLEPIYQLTCRDRNRIALQSDLLSAWVLGIESVLALTGDLPQLGDHPEAKPVFDLDSVGLLEAIKGLNEGHDMAGGELKGKPDFFAGAVVNPGADTEAAYELQMAKLRKKIAAGAQFIQTQAIYDMDKFEKFMKIAGKLDVPIIAGIIPLKSANMARYMNKNIPGVNVPEKLIEKMEAAQDKEKTGIEIAVSLIKKAQKICGGVHIMAIGWEKKVPKILDGAGL
ncbi:MAG: methylenetetrahydrofolate reductase [Chloroflexi bacterium]|nr:methylenetetrahydrofolate reductase [Chloroflexota bacterium]